MFRSDEERHADRRWVEREVQRLYVEERRRCCDWTEYMELALVVPYCCTCMLDDPWESPRAPDITPDRWRDGLANALGGRGRIRVLRILRRQPSFSFQCWRCSERLRPWGDDEVHVVTWFPNERYGVSMYEPNPPGRVVPSDRLAQRVEEMYGRRCFQCGSTDRLTMDHIRPVSDGGKGAFANLQPLCRPCNEKKADRTSEEVMVYSDICFLSSPAGAYEGLFPPVGQRSVGANRSDAHLN